MKNLLVTFSLFTIAFSANSQNWSPVSYGNKYHYTCDTTQTIFTLFADSFDVLGNDTLFYMNRIVLPCDTCVDLSGYLSYYCPVERTYLKNQPLFLMRNCYVSDSSAWCYSPAGFVIYPTRPVLSSWLYDTLNNITATISDKVLGSVLGNSDSLIIILLSTGDSIVLSKNFGAVKFPVNGGGYFRLYGIEGNLSIGERLAGYTDFFNFNVGDSFVYYISHVEPECYPDHTKRWYYSITSKDILTNGYLYGVTGWNCTVYWACVNPTNFTGNLCFRDSCQYLYFQAFEYSFLKYLPDEYFNSYSYQMIEDTYMREIHFVKRYKVNNDDYLEYEPRLLFNIENSSSNYNKDILVSENSQIDTTYYNCNSYNPANLLIARSGVGIIKQVFCQFEQYYLMDLLYCVSQGDTIYNLLVNTTYTENEFIVPTIYPNPARNSINLNNVLYYNISSIYSTSGKKVKEINLNGEKTEVDVSDLTPGLYFVILEGKNKRSTLKFVVE